MIGVNSILLDSRIDNLTESRANDQSVFKRVLQRGVNVQITSYKAICIGKGCIFDIERTPDEGMAEIFSFVGDRPFVPVRPINRAKRKKTSSVSVSGA